MGQFSRVNKNKDLYHDLIKDDHEKLLEKSLRDYEQRIRKVEKEEPYVASRFRPEVDNIDVAEDIDPIESNNSALKKEELLKDKDLLADFIEEVKHYNINRGLRTVQDTQMNILHNLNNETPTEKNKISEPEVVEPIKQNTVSELTQEIQAIIQDLETDSALIATTDDYDDRSVSVVTEELQEYRTVDNNEELESVFNEIETSALKLSQSIIDNESSEQQTKSNDKIEQDNKLVLEERSNEQSDFKSNELLELTQTLNLKLDLQDTEDTTASIDTKPKVELLDKFLTFVIIMLTVALIAFVIFGIYYVSKGRGL